MESIKRRNPATLRSFPGVSQLVRVGDLVFFGGQVPVDPQVGNVIASGDIVRQAERVYANLRLACLAEGGDLQNIVKTTTYLVRTSDMPAVSRVRVKLFEDDAPANATVVVSGLAEESMLIEIDAIGYIPPPVGATPSDE